MSNGDVRSSRRWVWFRAALAVVSAAVVGLGIYRLSDPPDGLVTVIVNWVHLVLLAVLLLGLALLLLAPVIFWRSGQDGRGVDRPTSEEEE